MQKDAAKESEAIISSVMARRASQGLRVIFATEHGDFTGYAKDAEQAKKWRDGAKRKGWIVLE